MENKFSISKIINILLYIFCFVLIVDPQNIFFGIKDVLYLVIILLLTIYYPQINVNKIFILIVIYALIIATLLRGVISGYNYNYEFTATCIKAFSPLLLLCWINRIELFSKIIFPSICISIVTLFIAFCMLYFPDLEHIIYMATSSNEDFIIMARRSFLGYEFINVFYRTIPLAIIPYSVFCYKYLFEYNNKVKTLPIIIVLGSALFFSGTRADILSTIFIPILFLIIRISHSKMGKILTFILFVIFISASLYIIISLLSETSENSNAVKFGHLFSYLNLFENNWDILLFGQGVGSLFYSAGFHDFTYQTEWSYVEIIRYVGLIGGLFIIGIYFYPLWIIFKYRYCIKYATSFGFGYLFYLLIAGTNPLLLSSTGMLALLLAYAQILSPCNLRCHLKLNNHNKLC